MADHVVIAGAFKRHAALMDLLPEIISDVGAAADMLFNCVREGKKIFTCGNGGSAADAQHLAAEWLCRYKDDRSPLAAFALTTDPSTLTAIGNDYGFEHVFARQVEALSTFGDVLVAFTTSGASKNILEALAAARRRGTRTIVLTGSGGARLRQDADIAIVVPSSETARIQEAHELIYHAWCEYVDASLASNTVHAKHS